MRAAIILFATLALMTGAPVAAAADKIFDIEAGTNADGSMYLKPNDFTVARGDNVTFRVKNVDTIFHDVAILGYDGRDIEIEVPAKKAGQATFAATIAGDFRVVCEVSGHKQRGMQGMIHVVETKTPLPEFLTLIGLAGAALLLRRS